MSQPDIYVDAYSNDSDFEQQTYSLQVAGPPYSPVLIDGTHEGSAGGMSGSALFGGMSLDGITYKLMLSSNSNLGIMAKSTDGGATWAVLDAAHGPAASAIVGVWDGDQTITCAWRVAGGGLVAVKLINFDLGSGTWGAAYGTSGGPTANGLSGVFLRGADVLVCYQSRDSFPPGAPSGLAVSIFTGGAWTTTVDLGANILGLALWDSEKMLVSNQSTFVMDAGGVLHAFFFVTTSFAIPDWKHRCFYQALATDNSLGSFEDFPGQVAPLPGGKYDILSFSGVPFGTPLIIADMIVVPVVITNRVTSDPPEVAALYIGTPVSSPVWSIDNTKSLDPDAFSDTTLRAEMPAALVLEDGVLWSVFSALAADGATNYGRLRLCQSSNLASPADGWSAITIFDLTVDTWPVVFVGQVLQVPSLGLPYFSVSIRNEFD